MRTPLRLSAAAFLRVLPDEGGFTLLECMLAIVLLTMGLLAAAEVFPHTTQLALYGKDQTRATNLAQQQMEVYRNTVTSTLAGSAGDYGTVASQYFDQNGNATTQASAYFTRDVQIQYWAWSAGTSAFVKPASPYVTPTVSYIYHVSVTTHWPVSGQTAFVSGTTPSGCVSGGSTVTVGRGCITLSTFTSP